MKNRRNNSCRLARLRTLPRAAAGGLIVLLAVAAIATPAPPTELSGWDNAANDFANLPPESLDRSQKAGALLRQIDPDRTLSFLIAFAGQEKPRGIRLNAFNALSTAALPQSISFCEKTALDQAEDSAIRASALGCLSVLDPKRAVDVGSICLRADAPEVRTRALWTLSRGGGTAAIAALEQEFTAAASGPAAKRSGGYPAAFSDKHMPLEALAATHDAEAARFILQHSQVDKMRRDRRWAGIFVDAMAGSPTIDAQPAMLKLMRDADCYLALQALPYFRQVLSPDAGPYLVDLFEYLNSKPKRLAQYPQLWFFANAPGLRPDSQSRLRRLVTEILPDAAFDVPAVEPPDVNEKTLGQVIAATFGHKPAGFYYYPKLIQLVVNGQEPSAQLVGDLRSAGYPVEATSRYQIVEPICAVDHIQRVADDQMLLNETFSDSVWAFLVARRGADWVLVRKERQQILCW